MISVDYIVNSVFSSRTYILSESAYSEVWLVDCGDFDKILDCIGDRTIAGVLLTHAHFDHIYGLPELLGRFPDCRIYTNEIGRMTLADSRLNMSLYHETPLAVDGPQVRVCIDGDEVHLYQDASVKVYETPGHHPSCLTFMLGDYLFTGDAYIPGIKVVTRMPRGDKKLAQESMERILGMAEGKTVLSGHQV